MGKNQIIVQLAKNMFKISIFSLFIPLSLLAPPVWPGEAVEGGVETGNTLPEESIHVALELPVFTYGFVGWSWDRQISLSSSTKLWDSLSLPMAV